MTQPSDAEEAFLTRIGDQIDDRVALAFDEQLTERLTKSRRNRPGGVAVTCTTAAAGAAVTIFAPDAVTTLLICWYSIVLINLAYFFRR